MVLSHILQIESYVLGALAHNGADRGTLKYPSGVPDAFCHLDNPRPARGIVQVMLKRNLNVHGPGIMLRQGASALVMPVMSSSLSRCNYCLALALPP